MKSLFGSLPNAHRNLGEPIPLPELRRVFGDLPITPLDALALEASWARWCRYFGLRSDVPDYTWTREIAESADLPTNPTLAQLEHLQERERDYFG